MKKLKIAFWLAFIIGAVWVFAVPPQPHVAGPAPKAVTVKVQPLDQEPESIPLPENPPAAAPGGEEQAPVATPSTAPQSSVTVPVAPNKEPALAPGEHPKIALIIDDVGLDLKGSERAMKLPPPVTLSFLPYAVRLREQTREAHDSGHEMLLHMPMEPIGHEDPGPGALFVDLPMRELQQRFEIALASFTGFDGVNNHMGSKFTAYPEGMRMVIDELQQRHLFFLDSRTSAESVGEQIAQEKGLPTIGRDVFLDDDPSPDIIRKQLEAAERIARRNGYAVAIGHPRVSTLDAVEEWIPDAQKRGFDFVPLNAVVKK